MIIYSLKSLFTYSSKEPLDLINKPDSDFDHNLYIDYNNFINSVSIIYGDQKIDGTIPVFWTRIKDDVSLEREADPNSTLKELKYNHNYYIILLDNTKIPLKIPAPIDSNKFLQLSKNECEPSDCSINCNHPISIISNEHRSLSLNNDTGYHYDIHIALSGLEPDKTYKYIIEPIFSNWPHKLSQISGEIVRNSPLDNIGYVSSSIDTKFMYLVNDVNNNEISLPFNLIDISKSNHPKNIFSLYNLNIVDKNNTILLKDTINITCDTCIPTKTPAPTPSITQTSTPTLTPTRTQTPTPTITVTPTTSLLDNNPNYYFIAENIDTVCFNPQYIILIYGAFNQTGSILFKDSALSLPWSFNELKQYIKNNSATTIFIKNRNITLMDDFVTDIFPITEIVNINGVATVGSSQVCPAPPSPTPTLTPTSTPTVTPTYTPTHTPAETPPEPNRRCPKVNLKNKNITINNKQYAEITAEFSYLDPYRSKYNYSFYSNEANWPSFIAPISGYAPINVTYNENNITYGSGSITAVLEFNKDFSNISNLNFEIPNYANEIFFNDNLYINLGINLYKSSDTRCNNIIDTINIVCDECVSSLNISNCLASVNAKIQNGSSTILLNPDCCDNTNTLSANISGLCPNYLYRYEWSSFPIIDIVPATGFLSINNNTTTLSSIYKLNNNSITNIKLKIIDNSTNKYTEDNIIIKCNNGLCTTPTPSVTKTPTI